jgi:FKBP-type peptidyl-prolyl cis-trans isomerase FklB
MKRFGPAVAALVLAACAATAMAAEPPEGPGPAVAAPEGGALSTRGARESYAVGVESARGILQGGIAYDRDAFLRGVEDGLAGRKLLLDDKELLAVRSELQREQMRRVKASQAGKSKRSQRLAEENRKAGEAFLAENARKEGVVSLPSGLQYRILKEGSGKKPTEGSTVECRYRSSYVDGTEFGRSDSSGKPATLVVSRLVPGFREALTLMPEGSKWQIFLPPRLAYGEQGTGSVAPWRTIIIEVELVAVR